MKNFKQMLIALSILMFLCIGALHAQPLQLGQSVATSYDAMDATYNVLRVVDIRPRPPFMNGGNQWAAPQAFGTNWTKQRMNDVFGIAIDDAAQPNIFVASSTVYCTNPHPTPAHIYKVDGGTWNVTNYVVTNNISGPPSIGANWIPNTGPGLGNLCWDKHHSQIFVTNHEDGKIYRIRDNGFGAGIVQSTFDPFSMDNGTVGIVDRRERLWGIGSYGTNSSDVRVYFSRWRADDLFTNSVGDNEIWSIALDNAGEFVPSTLRLELNMPPLAAGGNYSNPVSDIEFSFDGHMMVAERTMRGDNGPCYASGVWAHRSRILEFPRDGAGLYNDLIYTWHKVGMLSKTNSAGGVDLGYGWFDRNTQANTGCDSTFIGTGDYLFNPSPGLYVYGLQLSKRATNGMMNIEDSSHFIDMDNVFSGTSDKNSLGDVDVYRENICGDENDCVSILRDTVYCDSAGNYIYQFQVQNNSPTKYLNQVEVVVDSPLPPNYVVAMPSTINIMPSIPPGGISNVYTVNLVGPGAVARTEVCFTLSARFENDDCPWCCYIEKCIKLPDCYSCTEVLKDTIYCINGQYFFDFVLLNNTPFPVVKVQITSPGINPITFVPQTFNFGTPVLPGQPTPTLSGQILGGSVGVSFPVKFKLFYNETECCEYEVIYTFPPCGQHTECQCGEWKYKRYRIVSATGDTNSKPFNCNTIIGAPNNSTFNFMADFSCLPNDTNLCGDSYKVVIADGLGNTTSFSQSGAVNHSIVMNTDYQVSIYAYCGGRLCDSCTFRVRRTNPGKTDDLDGSKFGVSQNYPNPFNPSTIITFAVPVQSVVQLNIYDVSGRLVSTLVNNQKYEAGVYTVEFDGNNLPSGMYFYRFRTDNYIETRKMLLVK